MPSTPVSPKPTAARRAKPPAKPATSDRDVPIARSPARDGRSSAAHRRAHAPGDVPAPTEPFDIEVALARVAEAIRPFPKAALFELADDGFDTAFEQLVACLLSIRTYDEVSIVAARRLFAVARTPAEVRALGVERLDALIAPCTFHEAKAAQVIAIADRIVREFGGVLPCDEATLLSFRGVGPKCAHLTMGIACGAAELGVDIHVHRVTNRWGYVAASAPERSMAALKGVLPERHWVEINRLLVPFGKHVCTGVAPKCSACPLASMCRRVGVTSHR